MPAVSEVILSLFISLVLAKLASAEASTAMAPIPSPAAPVEAPARTAPAAETRCESGPELTPPASDTALTRLPGRAAMTGRNRPDP